MTDLADPAAARERALRSIAVPLGLANPLWLAFGAAAGAGACWWLLTRVANPFNAEAFFAGAAPAKAAEDVAEAAPVHPVDVRTPETTPVLLEVALGVAPAIVEAVEAPLEAALEAVQDALEAEAPAETDEPEADVEDDLTRLVGVGPRTARALIDRGVTRFAHLAAWTEEEVAAFDQELNLKGRSVRDAWLAQARRLAAEP
jgi:predicted flap endonuclease-1-like 5' DNA nuclease